MRRPTIRKGSFANVAAFTALVIAMSGGTAYAATVITSKQIKNGTIQGIDIRNSTIPGTKLLAGSIPGTKLVAGSIPGSKLAPGTIPAPYAGTAAYSTFHDAGVNIQNQVASQDPTILTLAVPAGSYVFNATTWLNNGSTWNLARCTLYAGGDSDSKRIALEPIGANTYAVPAALQAVHTFASPGVAKFSCHSFGVPAAATDSKLTAIKVDHLSNVPG